MLFDIAFAALGLVILLFAGDALVKGAVNLALRAGIPALLVSLTIVAFGTSAPELLISISAVLDGAAGIAMGNVVGSNIVNVLLVLGIPAIMTGLDTSNIDTRKTYSVMLVSTALFIVVCFFGPITWIHGLILMGAMLLVLGENCFEALSHRRKGKAAAEKEEVEGADRSMPSWKIGMFLLVGLVGLPLGADVLVESATSIARALNVSDTVIGLTLIAIGTSLPELATTVMAALRRQADVAIGNVIGSNIFNLLAIIGLASFVGDIPVPASLLSFDRWVMLAAVLVLVPFVFFRKSMSRPVGVALTGAYALYLLIVVI
jgi:cation:H+ antiporter